MFSGKTEELIRRLKRARIAGLKVKAYKSGTDVRYDKENVVSHDKNAVHAEPIADSSALLKELEEYDVIGIDEAQFFDDKLPGIVDELALKGVRVIVAGLDMDYKGNPFSPMPEIMATADFITKVHAICVHCGNLATHSYRLSEDEERVLLGERGEYEARCRTCFHAGPMLTFKSQKVVKEDEDFGIQSLFQEE